MSYSTKDLPQINIAYLITQYTREFRTGDVEAAVNYFTLICLNSDLPGALGQGLSAVCHEALRELTLETRDYAKLLGDIHLNGERVPGVIERRLELVDLDDAQGFLRTITLQAAAVADESVLVADAVLLYHLAGEYDKVVTVINKSLSEVVSRSLGASLAKIQPLKPYTEDGLDSRNSSLSLMAVDDPLVLAKNIMRLYSTDAAYYEKIQPPNLRTWKMLLRALEAKSKVEDGQWNEALDVCNFGSPFPDAFLGHANLFPCSISMPCNSFPFALEGPRQLSAKKRSHSLPTRPSCPRSPASSSCGA